MHQDEEMLRSKITELEAQVAKLKKAQRGGGLGFKVSDKGGVSVIGLGRFPLTLYASQWDRLLDSIPQLVDFISENREFLATKPTKPAE